MEAHTPNTGQGTDKKHLFFRTPESFLRLMDLTCSLPEPKAMVRGSGQPVTQGKMEALGTPLVPKVYVLQFQEYLQIPMSIGF